MGGGRHMINMLKYYMSYRQYNLMDQELLMRNVFERLSYVSMDTEGDLKKARLKPSGRRLYDRDFVLPDYTNSTKGKIRIPFALQKELKAEEERKRRQQEKQVLRVSVERFVIPEVLFRPIDSGLQSDLVG